MGLFTSVHGYNWSYPFEKVTCLPNLHDEGTNPGSREIKVGLFFSTIVEYFSMADPSISDIRLQTASTGTSRRFI